MAKKFSQFTDYLVNMVAQAKQLGAMYEAGLVDTLLPLTAFLRFKSKPFSLAEHSAFQPIFCLNRPKKMLFKCARQVGKSLSMATANLLLSIFIEDFSTLFVCPRFEQIKRFSNNYMGNLIRNSLLHGAVTGRHTEQNILQRSYASRSIQYFSFAFLDAERIRSYPVDAVALDEIQDINIDHMPVIEQTMGGSHYGLLTYTGTPKTLDNTIEQLWELSSQGERAFKCSCNGGGKGGWNIACVDEQLLKMIGKHTCVCAFCGKPIDTTAGCYVHRFPDRRSKFAAYHIAQPATAFFANYPEKWLELLDYQRSYAQYRFWNECLGESFDSSVNMITQTELIAACNGRPENKLDVACRLRGKYQLVVMGVDWTGGGHGASYTAITVGGLRPGTNTIDIFYVERLKQGLSPVEEVSHIISLFRKLRPTFIAHDYTGAGNLREVMLDNAGIPRNMIIPFSYTVMSDAAIVKYNQEDQGSRSSYSLDKPRSLVVTCTMIKAGKITLPKWTEDSMVILKDFLNIAQEVQERPRGSDIFLVVRKANQSDDIVHAANFTCSAIWQSLGKYPNLAEAMKFKMDAETIAQVCPTEARW